jgi:hypothetical protein
VQLAREGDDSPDPRRRGVARGAHRVEQVRRTVGADARGRPDRPRDHDGRLAAVQQVAQDRRLLERVRAVGHDDAASGGGLGGGSPGDAQRVGGGDVHPRPDAQGARAQAGDVPERRHRGDQGAGVERGHRTAAAGHRDRPAGGEHGDLARGTHRPESSRSDRVRRC